MKLLSKQPLNRRSLALPPLKKIALFTVLSGLLVSATGCSNNIKPPSSFVQDGGKIALIWSSQLEHGVHRKEGAQGLIDVMVNEALKGGLPDHVEKIKVAPLAEHYYLDPYGKKLHSEGFEVNVLKLPIEKAKLRQGNYKQNKKNKKSQFDLIPFGKQHNVKYALHLDISSFGSVQDYFGFIPTGGPKGNTQIKLTLIDTEDNSIIARFNADITENPDGNWDTPPTYSVMTEAILGSFEKALSDAYFGLFEQQDYDSYLGDGFSLGGGF